MPDHLLYGVAYYYEYLPYDRMEQDFQMMEKAGINTIRIAESTWSTWEPKDGVFDFTYLHRVLEAAARHHLSVIIGTPTYAIPSWLAKKCPDILVETHRGPSRYGARQIFDITHPGFLYHCERIIRRLLEEVRDYDCVIGFQIDNETKHYDTCSPRAQALFREWLKERFPTPQELNQEMGFAYWSNSIADYDDLPDVRGTINASFAGEYSAFQRHLVTEYLLWQRKLVDEYRRPDQFVTHNFDFEWRLYSFGFQPDVDQYEAAEAVTIAGCDIYHKSESHLTGAEIAFGGSITRNLKNDNYLVLETEAQGNFGWLPYPGQLRLQAFAHLASGADGVSYWHWHSIHNSAESYWKGLLSHDFSEGAVYQEACVIGNEMKRLSPKLLHLKKENKVAILAGNRSQTAFKWFPTSQMGERPELDYSDYLRWVCDACYELNLEYDILNDTARDFGRYDVLILPVLYAADESLIQAIDSYVKKGGHVIATFRSCFADSYLKIYPDAQPHGLTACFGVTYDRFTKPENVSLASDTVALPEHTNVSQWMELLSPMGAETLCTYDHPEWGGIPAVTRNHYGEGEAVYLGCYFDKEGLKALFRTLFPDFGLTVPSLSFPVILRTGTNQEGHKIRYYLNFSGTEQTVPVETSGGTELFSETPVAEGQTLTLPAWGVNIIEEQ
ncbi:MAG: beta-galactosidase [Eubacteriales bacterium]|nr:beta-galactosidase [Eubacteriales bacterium]